LYRDRQPTLSFDNGKETHLSQSDKRHLPFDASSKLADGKIVSPLMLFLK
jgi:hypothetical protein